MGDLKSRSSPAIVLRIYVFPRRVLDLLLTASIVIIFWARRGKAFPRAMSDPGGEPASLIVPVV